MPISSKLVRELQEMAVAGRGPPSAPHVSRNTQTGALRSAPAQPAPVSHGGPSRMMQVPEPHPVHVQTMVLPANQPIAFTQALVTVR